MPPDQPNESQQANPANFSSEIESNPPSQPDSPTSSPPQPQPPSQSQASSQPAPQSPPQTKTVINQKRGSFRLWPLILFFILLALGAAFYFFALPKLRPSYSPQTEKSSDISPTPTLDQSVKKLQDQSDSDEIEAIQKDLEETSLDNLDQESEVIDQELSLP